MRTFLGAFGPGDRDVAGVGDWRRLISLAPISGCSACETRGPGHRRPGRLARRAVATARQSLRLSRGGATWCEPWYCDGRCLCPSEVLGRLLGDLYGHLSSRVPVRAASCPVAVTVDRSGAEAPTVYVDLEGLATWRSSSGRRGAGVAAACRRRGAAHARSPSSCDVPRQAAAPVATMSSRSRTWAPTVTPSPDRLTIWWPTTRRARHRRCRRSPAATERVGRPAAWRCRG